MADSHKNIKEGPDLRDDSKSYSRLVPTRSNQTSTLTPAVARPNAARPTPNTIKQSTKDFRRTDLKVDTASTSRRPPVMGYRKLPSIGQYTILPRTTKLPGISKPPSTIFKSSSSTTLTSSSTATGQPMGRIKLPNIRLQPPRVAQEFATPSIPRSSSCRKLTKMFDACVSLENTASSNVVQKSKRTPINTPFESLSIGKTTAPSRSGIKLPSIIPRLFPVQTPFGSSHFRAVRNEPLGPIKPPNIKFSRESVAPSLSDNSVFPGLKSTSTFTQLSTPNDPKTAQSSASSTKLYSTVVISSASSNSSLASDRDHKSSSGPKYQAKSSSKYLPKSHQQQGKRTEFQSKTSTSLYIPKQSSKYTSKGEHQKKQEINVPLLKSALLQPGGSSTKHPTKQEQKGNNSPSGQHPKSSTSHSTMSSSKYPLKRERQKRNSQEEQCSNVSKGQYLPRPYIKPSVKGQGQQEKSSASGLRPKSSSTSQDVPSSSTKDTSQKERK